MSAKEKSCGLLDYPKESEKELNKILASLTNVVGLPYDSYLFEKVKLSIVYENVKKYRIEVPNFKFVGDFYQGDGIDIIFDAKWGEHARTFKFHTSVEQAAAEWFLDMLGDEGIYFEKIEMEAIGKLDNYQDKPGLFIVNNLEFNITDNNYKNGQLEWWIKKFRKEIKTLKINSPGTNGVVVKISEDFDSCPEHLELKGRFVIPHTVFPRTKAEKVVFEDYSKETIINSELIILILKDWLAVAATPKEITLIANYEEKDIEQKVYNYMNKNRRVFEKDELTGAYTYKEDEITMTFYRRGTSFNLKIFLSLENLKNIEQSKK